MKMKTILPALLIFSTFFFTKSAKAIPSYHMPDTVCCPPVKLQVVSTIFPTFCVSWQVNMDSNCIKTPYGYQVQWAAYPGTGPWSSATVVYSGGNTINFCANADTCRNYQWRVRTICDTSNGGTYSNWVYGRKFAMTCNHDGQKGKINSESADHKVVPGGNAFIRRSIYLTSNSYLESTSR